MNDNYLQVRNPQDLKKITNINLAIDKAIINGKKNLMKLVEVTDLNVKFHI